MWVNASSNSSAAAAGQYVGVVERALFSALITLPCCACLLVNVTLSAVLRSRPLFRESSRYVLLLNLLLADTAQMSLGQLLYLLAVSRIRLTYPVCGVLNMATKLTSEISPLTLVVMSLERYVAVCFPLRHAQVATGRNTLAAILAVWAASGLNVATRVLLLLDFPFHLLPSLLIADFCSDNAMLIGPASHLYDRAFTGLLFVSATLAIVASFAGVASAAARSAAADGASARKARNTVLLHLLQLALSLSSTIYNPLLSFLYAALGRLVFVRLQNFLYVCVFIFPRCLSSLIYGIRDQNIRPALLRHLGCRLIRTNTC